MSEQNERLLTDKELGMLKPIETVGTVDRRDYFKVRVYQLLKAQDLKSYSAGLADGERKAAAPRKIVGMSGAECSKCGETLPKFWKYCPNCGVILDWDKYLPKPEQEVQK